MIGRHSERSPISNRLAGWIRLYERNYLAEGYSYFMAHKYDEAIEQYRKNLEIEPDPMTYFGLVLALAGERGLCRQAISEGKGRRN